MWKLIILILWFFIILKIIQWWKRVNQFTELNRFRSEILVLVDDYNISRSKNGDENIYTEHLKKKIIEKWSSFSEFVKEFFDLDYAGRIAADLRKVLYKEGIVVNAPIVFKYT